MADLPRLALRLSSATDSRVCAALAGQAERCGFQTVWFAENPYQRGVLPAAAACIAETSEIGIGIGIFNPYNRHPTLMAMEIGALDELSGGRAILGIGAGVPAWIDKIVPFEAPLAALRDATLIARGLLAGEEVSHEGKVFSAKGVKLDYPLVRDRVPVYVAAMAEGALRACGELGDGLIIGNMCPPAYTQRAVRLLSEGADRVGRATPGEIVKYIPCAVRPRSADARHAVKPQIAAMIGAYWAAYERSPGTLSAIVEGNGIDPELFSSSMRRLAEGEPAVGVLDDGFVDAYTVAGTVEECLDQCRTLGRTGVTEVALSFLGEDPAADMRLFADAIG